MNAAANPMISNKPPAKPLGKVDLDRIASIATPVVDGAGYELVDLEWKRELGGWILRMFIDKPGGPHPPGQGIGLDACADVSRELSTLLDVEEEAAGLGGTTYELEVGSPGIDRPLRKPADFARSVGHKLKVRTSSSLGPPPGRRNFAGVLVSFTNGDLLHIDVGDRVCEVPIREVEKANLQIDLQTILKPAKGSQAKQEGRE